MNSHNKHIIIVLTSLIFLLLGVQGCKSPIDLDNQVIEVPVQTKPIDKSDIRTETDGNVRSPRFGPNGPIDLNDFSFDKSEIDDFYIDTTDRLFLKVALKVKTRTNAPDRSQYEELIPHHLEFEMDTVRIPVFDNPPSPKDKNFVLMKEAEMKLFVFAKKKEQGGIKIVRSEKSIDLTDERGNNSLNSFVYAIRKRVPGNKTMTTLHIEQTFSVNGVEIDSFDRKFPASSNGRSIIRIQF